MRLKLRLRSPFWLKTSLLLFSQAATVSGASNVLFIMLDDLRPELGAYGKSHVVSPNIDRLAASGTVFERAYCQQAVCNPSRASLLTGLRPDSTGVYDLLTHFRGKVPDVVTLPQNFKNHGYRTLAFGKIFHPGTPYDGVGPDLSDPVSWSEPHWLAGRRHYFSPGGGMLANEMFQAAMLSPQARGATRIRAQLEAAKKSGEKPKTAREEDDWKSIDIRALATEAPEVPDNVLNDGQVAEQAVAALRRIKGDRESTTAKDSRPFFLAVGFSKPHLPFVAPRKYWDLYDPVDVRLAPNPGPPFAVPAVAMPFPAAKLDRTANSGGPFFAPAVERSVGFNELSDYPKDVEVPFASAVTPGGKFVYDLPQTGLVTRAQAVQLRRGYYACISYVDALMGKVLAELERLDLARDTIVVLLSDHGYSLGEHGLWGKLSNFEDATRTPLIISAPGKLSPGGRISALAELVDIYPTLSDLAGIPKPSHLEGTSLAPLMADPRVPWKAAAFSQYPRQGVMGYSMRTDRYRYTLWQLTDDARANAGVELYDHTIDPFETVNLAGLPESAEIVAKLDLQLRRGWKHAIPPHGSESGVSPASKR